MPNSLFEHRSSSMDGVTFFFHPLTGKEQELYRKSYLKFESTYDLMSEVVANQVELYHIESMDEYHVWPQDPVERKEFVEVVPEDVVIELGAAILGWVRAKNEGNQQFIDRIMSDLRDSIQGVER